MDVLIYEGKLEIDTSSYRLYRLSEFRKAVLILVEQLNEIE
jgi:hypothetical protein